jgi:hypothetical protein
VKIPQRYKVFFILLSCLIYYILGGWIYLFYVVLCVARELFFSKHSRKYIYAVLNSLVYFICPYIAARYLFIITLKDAYLYIIPLGFYRWPFNFNLNLYCYLFFFSLPVLLIALFVYLKYIKVEVKGRKVKKQKVKKRKSSLVGKYHTLIQSISIILAAVLILTFSFEQREKKKVQIDYLAQQGRWNELLNISRGMEEYTVLILFNVNRALYHTGQLLDNLFNYPQVVGADVLFLENFPRPGAIPSSDLYFDLGHVRAAEVMAYEGHTKFGYNPRMLKRIVTTNIINEKYDIAKKFLDLLNKSILHKKWVKHYRNYLFNESLIESDSLIQLKRKLMPKSDFFIAVSKNSYKDLIELLKENENNKMAFEYLMAYYLLDCRFEDLMEHLDKFKKLGYKKYPRNIEEALLLIEAVSPSESAKFGYSINEQTIKRFKQFHNIRSELRNKKVDPKEVLRKGFYNTYWYYILYIRPEETKRD